MLLATWTVPAFLEWWFGPPARIGRRPVLDLPPALLDFYAALDAYDGELLSHNRLVAPELVQPVDGLLVFWLESEGVSEWATDGAEVFERLVSADITVDVDWTPTETSLTDFLVSVVAFEAALGAEHTVEVEDVEEVVRRRLLAGLSPAPMPGPILDTELHTGDGVLAFSGEGFAILASRRPALLEPFGQRAGTAVRRS